jgi:hypothetical protein
MGKTVSIVAFDFPYPPVYGGIIDVFYKIRSFHSLNFEITLHCYTRKSICPTALQEVSKFCKEIYWYPRKFSFSLFLGVPYIISSRNDGLLYSRLVEQASDLIWVEGIHCSRIFWEGLPVHSYKVVRMHNIEWKYYKGLAKNERSLFKKLYFWLESFLLRIVERRALSSFDEVLTLSHADHHYFKNTYKHLSCHYLPAFHPNDGYFPKTGKGKYLLFHGDLSIADTEFQLRHHLIPFLSGTGLPLYIAGRNPSQNLLDFVATREWIRILPNPDLLEMDQLIQESHIILLATGIQAGIKLKLLESLFKGRFVVANAASVEGSGLEPIVHLVEGKASWEAKVLELWNREFGEEDNLSRQRYLEYAFNNNRNLSSYLKKMNLNKKLWNTDI